MKYEFICKDCGEVIRNTSKAALVLLAQKHYTNLHKSKGKSGSGKAWDETVILSEIHQVQS